MRITRVLCWVGFFLLFFFLLFALRYLFADVPVYMGKSTLFKQYILTLPFVMGIVTYISAFSQFAPHVRQQHPQLHKRIGWLFMLASILCIASLYGMLPNVHCADCNASQYIVASTWLLFVVLGYVAIQYRKVVLHQRSMISAFICSIYFILARVLDKLMLPFFLRVFSSTSQAHLISDLISLGVPLLLCWFIWQYKDRRVIHIIR